LTTNIFLSNFPKKKYKTSINPKLIKTKTFVAEVN